jgi:hypothetical protein
MEMCERCVKQFLREGKEVSDLWKAQDPYLNEYVLYRCGLDNIEQVTMTDLIEKFIPREGRDRTVWDQPQIVTRTNQGLHDRKFRETATSRAKRVMSEIVSKELDGMVTPPESPSSGSAKIPQKEVVSDSVEKETIGQNSGSTEVEKAGAEGSNANGLAWTSGLSFVLDCKTFPQNPNISAYLLFN